MVEPPSIGSGGLAAIGRQSAEQLAVKWVPTAAIFNLDHPEVGIAFDSTCDIGVGLSLRHQIAAERAQPPEPAVEVSGLGQNAAASVQLVELEQHGASFGLAAPDQGGRHCV